MALLLFNLCWVIGENTMLDEQFRAFVTAEGLSNSTVSTKSAALRRIERDEGVDLDKEYSKDHLTSLFSKFQFSMDDVRAGRENPTSLDIEPDKLYRDLAFYRSMLGSYIKFKRSMASPSDSAVPVPEPVESAADELVTEEVARTFGLERDLQNALRGNISQFDSSLSIVDGGVETKVAAGYIDILAKDKHGDWVVIELKAETARAPAIAQVLAYMGCIKREKGGNVKGLLIAAEFEDRVRYAADAVPNLSLKKYGFRFQFEDF